MAYSAQVKVYTSALALVSAVMPFVTTVMHSQSFGYAPSGGQLGQTVKSGPPNRPALRIPLDCDFGGGPRKCHIAFYPDHDDGQGVKDYKCGARTYNAWSSRRLGHTGTDFAILDESALKQFEGVGPAVLAAAPGVVTNTRTQMPDTYDIDPRSKTACGNRVSIRHDGNWYTDYCHLAANSIRVAVGDQVDAKQPIGRPGISGNANFYHLHFTVGHRSASGQYTLYDPFSGTPLGQADCEKSAPLWSISDRLKMPYRSVQIVKTGFTERKPRLSTLLLGQRSRPTLIWDKFEPIIGFTFFYGLTKGMTVQLAIVDEKGSRLAKGGVRITKPMAAEFKSLDLRQSQTFQDYMVKAGRAPLGEISLFTRVVDEKGDILATSRARSRLVVSDGDGGPEKPAPGSR